VKPCIPDRLPLDNIDWGRLVEMIGEAQRRLAEYKGMLKGIPNAEILLSPLMTREAVLSSRIEGSLTTVPEVLEYEAAEIPEKRNDDIKEIINYRQAIFKAVSWLSDRDFSIFFIKNIHNELLNSVRGKDKSPGQIRNKQNYIGRIGTSIENARFIPPAPELVADFLQNLEEYLRFEERDAVVQTAVIHAQFEIIHPFDDGNGRTGRMLIPLFLYKKELLDYPNFYISEYFESHRQEYSDRLLLITERGDWHGWIEFFLRSVSEQSTNNIIKANAIKGLYEEIKEEVQDITKSPFVVKIIDTLFRFPFFNTTKFAVDSRISKPSVNRIIKELFNAGIIDLAQESKGRNPAIYVFPRLLDIVK
jgi:Fic family protein